jgi:hypothetical protein
MSNAGWTTRIDPRHTRAFGVEEIHSVCFEPIGWPGKGICIGLGIPECEMHYVYPPLTSDVEPLAVVNRPHVNKSVKYWLRYVCKLATAERTFVALNCDTAEQAADAARMAARWLPEHRRAALERLYSASSRARDKLS